MTASASALCGHRNGNGRPCRRKAGAGTHHPGQGACDKHDPELLPPLTDNPEAQAAILDLLRDPSVTPREAAERHGYRRRDIRHLRDHDPEFEHAYRDARGYSADRIVGEIVWIAFDRGNASQLRALQMLAKGDQELQAMVADRLEVAGRVQLQAVPYVDVSLLSRDGIRPELAACTSEVELLAVIARITAPAADRVPPGGVPALELVSGGNG